MRRLASIAAVLTLVGAACGGGTESLPSDALVIVVSSDLAVGSHRVAVGALGANNESLVTDEPVSLEFFRPDGTPAGVTPARFMWAIPDVRGMWVAGFQFDAPGRWTVGVRTSDNRLVPSAPFNVGTESASVGIGDVAPPSNTRTASDASLSEISSDPDPDPRFYDRTVADAVTSGQPSVIVFATPAFCTSATCGPALDVAKTVIDDYPNVAWVHVEVYENLDAASLEELVLTPAVSEWGLFTEPWVFVVGGDGIVTSRFEGAMDETELRAPLERVAG